MANRLAGATSPYLLQHADNPVDWWEWGDEAFAEARRRNVPAAAERGVRRLPLVPRGGSIDGFWRTLTKPQVSGGVAVRAGSAMTAHRHRFRGFVHHSRASLGPHHWSASGSHLSSPTQQLRAPLRNKIGRVAVQMYNTLVGVRTDVTGFVRSWSEASDRDDVHPVWTEAARSGAGDDAKT